MLITTKKEEKLCQEETEQARKAKDPKRAEAKVNAAGMIPKTVPAAEKAAAEDEDKVAARDKAAEKAKARGAKEEDSRYVR